MTHEVFGARLQRLAALSGFTIAADHLPTICAIILNDLHSDACSSAVAKHLRDVKLAKPYAFAPLIVEAQQ